MYGLTLNVTDDVTPFLNRMHATLTRRENINEKIGAAVEMLCRNYVQADAPSRHDTADKLGADPTNFVAHAAQHIHFTSTASIILVDFSHPWFSAVGHDVDIEPGAGKQYLAIPIGADAYGKRLQGQTGGTFFRSKHGGLFWGRPYPGNERVLQPLYVLVKSVHQKQDRSRLPSDQEILDCVRRELRAQIEQRIAISKSIA